MKKTFLSIVIIGIFILYCFVHTLNAVAITPSTTSSSSSSSTSKSTTSSSSSSSSSTATSTPTATATSTSQYKDGTYTGTVADAQWGWVQVQVTIKDGKITNVQFLQYPNERDRSVQINNYADPILVNEAIKAQSANVDIVSGATDTSQAFIQSLSSALTQAKA